jgi:hypothetical protein
VRCVAARARRQVWSARAECGVWSARAELWPRPPPVASEGYQSGGGEAGVGTGLRTPLWAVVRKNYGPGWSPKNPSACKKYRVTVVVALHCIALHCRSDTVPCTAIYRRS